MSIATSIIGDPVTRYLNQCQVRNGLVENEETAHVPPSSRETKELLRYLKAREVSATIVGSVGVLHYVKDPKQYRPTVDLDLFIELTAEKFQKVAPPAGWRIDRASPGVISWISPTNGYVDFMTAGHEFPGGGRTPSSVSVDPSSREYPIATAVDIFKMKLNSMREKDLSDLISLARALGRVPTIKELGVLNQTQQENLGLVQQWFKLRPSGSYGH